MSAAKTQLEQTLAGVDSEIAGALAGGSLDVSKLNRRRDVVELQLVRIALSEVRDIGESVTIAGRTNTRAQLLERERELMKRVTAHHRGGARAFQVVPNV